MVGVGVYWCVGDVVRWLVYESSVEGVLVLISWYWIELAIDCPIAICIKYFC